MSIISNINSALKRVFRTYNAEANRTLSPWRKAMLAVDESYLALLAARDNASDERKNKRQVRSKRSKTGFSGVLSVRDHGSVEEKLRKAIGGKSMRRILKRERRLGRENPEALAVHAVDDEGNKHPLVRGVDFAMIPPAFGGPSLVLHDMATKFEATYSNDFATVLSGGHA